MSIKTAIEDLSYATRQRISGDLHIQLKNKYNIGRTRNIYAFSLVNDTLTLPFAYATRKLKLKRPVRDTFPIISSTFTGELRSEQKVVRKEALRVLNRKGSVMISAYPGFGKTIGAIDLALKIKFKILVIANKIVLMKQWKKSIEAFCSERCGVQIVHPGDAKTECDFYVMNAQNVEKTPKGFFDDIGTVIVDEAHMIMAETLSKSLQYVSPRYLIGLTATPYRPDGLDILLELYFGDDKIVRELVRDHTVYKVTTGFKPPIERTITGRLNWGTILDAQANNEHRNDLIIRIIRGFPDRNFLVLVKRVIQGRYLRDKLKDLGESVTDLIGSNQIFDKDARILVGTCQKVGVGFDHAKLDTLLLAADIEEYFIQYLGRVFRRKDVKPIVFDFVDDNGTLKKHFNTRKSVYKKHGGTVENFALSLLRVV
jgi:superfamily II DNA or RNA helicase